MAAIVVVGIWVGLVYWGLTPQQPPGSYQGGEMMKMKSVCMLPNCILSPVVR